MISSWFSPSSSSSPTPTDNQYGLSSTSFADLLAAEYPAIHSSELVHLDHAASPPPPISAVRSRLGFHPALSIARIPKKGETKHAVLLDAAAYLSTSPLDLSTVPYEDAPDFVVGSFYKVYGHPTGLGFLLVKRSSVHFLTLRKPTYFGGGAIEAISVSSPYWIHPRGSQYTGISGGLVHERFENGTAPYLSVVALGCAMDSHQRLFSPPLNSTIPSPSSSLRAVSHHTHFLADLTRASMLSLKHWDDTPLVRIHKGEGSELWEDDGPTIAFTLYTPSSSSNKSRCIGHTHLLNLATLANIQLRTGGLCNTGVLARVSGLSDRELFKLWEDGRVCGDAVEFGGDTCDKPLGLARISFGACSRVQDVHKFIDFLKRYFLVSKEVMDLTIEHPLTSERIKKVGLVDVYLKSLVRYPIKSCAGESLTSARLTSHGIVHDREFAIINSATGKILSQKQFPRMVLMRPSISDDNLVMCVNAPEMPELVLPLKDIEVDVKTCSNVVESHRILQHPAKTSAPTASAPILFSNESPFTLISISSVDVVDSWIQSPSSQSGSKAKIHPSCFRANFTLSSQTTSALPPFLEDKLAHEEWKAEGGVWGTFDVEV
ncbi:putative secondary metabolism biosynthetic enzyme [Termitomyces sp. T159_Od127]|nr:putative secondary metabolism biosynthetic enzyme [Termitomyces sp. T159_Od127]